MSPALFETWQFAVRSLATSDLRELQALFDANPAYFLAVNARQPRPDEAESEFNERPPPFLSCGQRWFAGVFDRCGALQGVVHFVSDLMAPGVWHIALFFVATALHGSGAARELHGGLEAWMQQAGAAWIRLGVVAGNARAERFWARMGYVQTRVRKGVDTGGKINDMRMLVKPLRGGSVEQYLALVARDRPDSTLP